ncbi:toprim domain-containing protein, partial [Enterobacter roggenkampii]|uniref:toprim domain-containing protein n=1 Tax=Enterobacter roggenkampii TaxID=1812935 RepID=UPI003B840881
ENEIVSFYFRSILYPSPLGGTNEGGKHYYLKNRSGIYPGYPNKEAEKLILTEAIIDAASLLQIPEIKHEYSIISCFGTNGLNEEILQAIKELKKLEEIIFCFDQDDAGRKAVKKYAEDFRNYKVTTVELPNKDVNETLQLHNEELFTKLLEERKFVFSNEIESSTQSNKKEKTTEKDLQKS